ncbi:hypothetical protein LTR48_001201 [Friedmanniomyces endolithicus]|uniref:DUF7587 domain-containing protein n=1 Tax=Rachicladosporium monterosium TaxID=1507873 RepID=A0ABR0LE85_9PEZI|nr:hypothetical protein LTS09_008742 [Friedmanniomyces endolithicus]KAK0945174.1 hypothetical protein LTR29_003266 [Friedmanniomyces endolithicus]KAK1094003.1 hypothetical protein LTR48_001201 [Friedmanniomyces endolithicus]KAK5147512.1 hypothetical protein LTR32_001065 [Rachicladosporium monterosium]
MAEARVQAPGNGKIVWTHEMRVAVWLLFRPTKFDKTTRTAVFNALYKDYLETLGLPDGANYSRIEAQYHEHSSRRSSAAWRATMTSIASETTEQEELLSRIQDMASHLGYGIDHMSTLTRRADITDVPGTAVTYSRKRGRIVAPEAVANPIERNKRATVHVEVGAGMTLSPPRTPPKTSAIAQIPKQRRPEATVLHSTETGHRVWLTPEEHLETQNAWVPVPDHEAHPPLAGGLLYRYWDDTSQCPLVNGEFKASRFARRHIRPAPLPELDSLYFPWDDLHAHLNGNLTETSFISTSNYLVWILRTALQRASQGKRNGCITVIDSTRLPRSTVLYVPPFHRELCKKKAFTDAAWYYQGSHEFVVYEKIPAEAIVHPGFRIADLQALAARDPNVEHALQLQTLEMGGNYRKVLRPILRAAKVGMKPPILSAMAKLVRKLLTKVESPAAHVAHLVTDIVHGVKWACGSYNARFTAEGIEAVQRRAARVGLRDPLAILNRELEVAKAQTIAYFGTQQFAIGGNNGGQQLAFASSSQSSASRATKRRIRDRDRSPCERPRSRPSRREPSMPITPTTTRFSVNRGRSAMDEEILYETPVKRRKR